MKSIEKTSPAHLAAAARKLIEGAMADAGAGRFSRTVFAANRTNDDDLERCTFDSALNTGVGAVSLRFNRDSQTTPIRANIAFMHQGARVEVRGCVLWSGDDGPMILVPFDAREDHHYAIGSEGLERRRGRPAKMLGRGMSRAKARLERTARELRREGPVSTLTILTPADAA